MDNLDSFNKKKKIVANVSGLFPIATIISGILYFYYSRVLSMQWIFSNLLYFSFFVFVVSGFCFFYYFSIKYQIEKDVVSKLKEKGYNVLREENFNSFQVSQNENLIGIFSIDYERDVSLVVDLDLENKKIIYK